MQQELMALAKGWLEEKEQVNIGDIVALQKIMEPAFEQAGYRVDGEVKKILLLRFDAIGDMVLTSAFIREVRRNYPHAFITVVCRPLTKSLLEYCPYVNEVLCFETTDFLADFPVWWKSLLEFCKVHLWQHYYDLCLCPQWGGGKFDTMLIAYMSGSYRRYAYSSGVPLLYLDDELDLTVEHALLTQAIYNPPEIVAETERYLYLLQAVGGTVTDDRLEAWYSSEDGFRAEAWLNPARVQGKLIIAMGIGASDDTHKYPINQWHTVIEKLIKKIDVCFVLLGGPEDKGDGRYLQENCASAMIIDLTGKTSLREAAAVLAEADLFLGNDSGMMHLATAVKTPVVACYREAMDKEYPQLGYYSECARFVPWSEQAIMLRPDKSAGNCKDVLIYGGCKEKFSHCIAGIDPDEILEAVSLAICSWVK
ncbi:glycosyltransferase family 9 protein [Selenomonas ruminantium]|uniref:glycosyltransferase family 9 protein n=1 Tax=Selenomonas ruminantium TaxID=971 RepID=UPI000479282B|nr:glycosyltransferase family 9 protein [Selenomonas ruminantium]